MKISYGLRAFAIYFVILGTLIWFTLDNAIERLNDGMRQSAESVLVDTANLVASFIEDEIDRSTKSKPGIGGDTTEDKLGAAQLKRVFSSIEQRQLLAQIYQVSKTSVDSEIYVTDDQGMVIFDSSGQHEGENFRKWRDVHLTLDGQYGARTSYLDQARTEPEDAKAMIIAAPIRAAESIIGVVSVVKPIESLEGHLLTESKQLQRYAFALLALALILGYLLSLWFTNSLNKIANYANDMAAGKKVDQPTLRDSRLADLSESISNLRSQLDGKEYVENYIHSLTHELKTPITSIRGAVELITEDMPARDQQRFINNISTSNQRMSRLVDRMLSLAKLEGTTELVATTEFDIVATCGRLLQERSALISALSLQLEPPTQSSLLFWGDKMLISQAIANLLDNAISFCRENGTLSIQLKQLDKRQQVSIFNQGDAIPDFAMDKLFDRFFSLPRPNPNQQSGKSTGLGLSFVREIMKLHEGSIKVENVSGGVLATLSWPTSNRP